MPRSGWRSFSATRPTQARSGRWPIPQRRCAAGEGAQGPRLRGGERARRRPRRHAPGHQRLRAARARGRAERGRLPLLRGTRSVGLGHQLPDPGRREVGRGGRSVGPLAARHRDRAQAEGRGRQRHALRGAGRLPQRPQAQEGGLQGRGAVAGPDPRDRGGGDADRLRHRRGGAGLRRGDRRRALRPGAGGGDRQAGGRGGDHVPQRAAARARGHQAGAAPAVQRPRRRVPGRAGARGRFCRRRRS